VWPDWRGNLILNFSAFFLLIDLKHMSCSTFFYESILSWKTLLFVLILKHIITYPMYLKGYKSNALPLPTN
jgi:hypothetical protein